MVSSFPNAQATAYKFGLAKYFSRYFAKPPGPYTQLPQNKNFKTILQGLS
jgi:hypothetical protein